jgi:hypothetical protein
VSIFATASTFLTLYYLCQPLIVLFDIFSYFDFQFLHSNSIAMVFRGIQPTGSKKTSGIARRPKQGTSYRAHQATQAVLPIQASLSSVHELPESGEESPDRPPNKKLRPDDNWRAARAVRSRDEKIERIQVKHNTVIQEMNKLRSANINLQVKVSKQKQAVLEISNKKYNEAKAHRVASLEKEEAHKVALAALCKEHARKIEDAFRIADEATGKVLIAEEDRLSNDRAHSSTMRAERERHSIKLKKERTDKNLVHSTWHQRWITSMARNMTEQRTSHKKDI